jgi:BON domain
MSYDEEQQRRSRVVVETPTSRREVVQSQTVRYPEERRGYSVGIIAAVALTAIAATVIIMLFLTNPRDDSDSTTNVNLRASAPAQPTPYTQAPVIVQATPLGQPTPIIIQQAPATQPPPIIVAPPPTTTEPSTSTSPPSSTTAPPASSGASASDDLSIQQRVDRLFAEDRDVSAANVFATVVEGRVRLTGTVSSESVKQRAERLAYTVKGVLGVDNRITVSPAP